MTRGTRSAGSRRIQDLTELGSGFRLANMDLEIRGAGEPARQRAVAGTWTCRRLRDLHGAPGGDHRRAARRRAREVEVDPEIRLPVAARLPDDYVPEVSQRLVLYKRLAGARDEGEADGIRDELLDRFGPLPAEAESLLRVIRLKIAARLLGAISVTLERGEIVLAAAETTRVDPQRLVQLMTRPEDGIRVTPDQRVRVDARGLEGEALFEAAHRLIEALAA